MICPNCGTELEDGSLDCSVCGYEFEYEEADESDYEAESSEGIECPYCGSVIEAGSAICPVCQSEIETNEEDIAVTKRRMILYKAKGTPEKEVPFYHFSSPCFS